MHTGKLYEAGRTDAFKECFDAISNIVKDKEGVVKFVGPNGEPTEYLPLDVIRAYGLTLLALSGDKRMLSKLEKYERNLGLMNKLKEIWDERGAQGGKEEEV